MLAQLLASLSFSLFVSHAAITCNSVTLKETGDSPGVTLPIDVCIQRDINGHTLLESRKLVCDSNGVATMQYFADNFDCSGTGSVEDVCYNWGMDQCVSTSICNSSPCAYTYIETWDGVTQCAADVPADNAWVNRTILPMIFDTDCDSTLTPYSMQYSCVADAILGDSLDLDMYSSADCSGTVMSQSTLFETGCNALNQTAAIVQCNQVAGPTPMPTAPTASQPTAPTTASGSSCNSVEIRETATENGQSAMAHPIDICVTRDLLGHTEVNSGKLVCDNGVGRLEMYAGSADCSGTPSFEDPCHFDWELEQCGSTSVCDSVPCTYAALEYWDEVTECNGEVPATDKYVNHTIMGLITDTCELNGEMSIKYSCVSDAISGDSLTASVWDSNDCSGTALASMPVLETGCDSVNKTAAIVQCDQVVAAPTTQSPTAPTAPTAPTTKSPTTSSPTTASPTTASPTTASPTTTSPTTASPTTASPTTAAPTTASPTTASPTTASPTSAIPTSETTTSTEAVATPGGSVVPAPGFTIFCVFSIHMVLNA